MKKVITYGSFDLFHEGHYKLLQRAKALGDYLIVGITTESYDASRGKLNVVDSLIDRIEHVKATGFADEIIIEDHKGQKIEDILKYKIDIFTVGSDWIGQFDYIKQYCEVVYLERTKDISSTLLRQRNFSIVKLGIVGCGRIASRFVPEAKYVSGVNVESVFNPHAESAKNFAGKFELNHWYDNYSNFLDSIDAVYIASPHQTHFLYAKEALEHDKHVLCEKPLTLTKTEAETLFRIAEEHNCILMEAIKTAYCPGFSQLLGIVRSGIIGEIKDVEATFTKLESPNSREMSDCTYGGSITELGSYTVLPIIKILGCEYNDVHYESITNEKGIDIYSKIFLRYPSAMATAKVGLGVKSEGQLLISGTKGYILVEAPWWKTQSFEVKFEDQSQNEKYFSKYLGEGLRYELSDFISAINGFEQKTYKLSDRESETIAAVIGLYLNGR